MFKNKKKINVIFSSAEEEQNLYECLSLKGYHWLSGQEVKQVPAFLPNPFKETEKVTCVRCLDLENKTVGYVPMEIFTDSERDDILTYVEIRVSFDLEGGITMCMYCERRTDVKFGWEQPKLPYHNNMPFGSDLSGNVLENEKWNGVIHDYQTATPELILTCPGYFNGEGVGAIYIPIKYCPECGRKLGREK